MNREPQEVTEEQMSVIAAYAQTFNTEAGRIVLEDLKAEYGGESYVRGDFWESQKRMHGRDLISRIEEMVGMAAIPTVVIKEE